MRYALDAIWRRPGRSALTALGIGLAVGLVVLLLSLSAGVQTSATALAYASGVDLLAVSPGSNITSGQFPPVSHAHALATSIPGADPNVAAASPWLIDDLAFGNSSLWGAANNSTFPSGWSYTESGTVGWIPSDNTGIETPTIYQGAGFTYPGDPHYAGGNYTGPSTHQIVLDQALAGVLHVGVGDPIWASATEPPSNALLRGWYANATEFTVAGVSGPFWLVPSALLGFVYLSELQQLYGGASSSTDYATLVLIHLTDPTHPTIDQGRISAAFPGLSLYTLGNILGEIQHVVNLYRTFGFLVGAIGVVVAALFTTTVLQMSVDDRSRELALLRAIGCTRATVGARVVEEALILSVLGLAVGLPIAYVGAVALNHFLLGLLPGLPSAFSFVSFDAGVILTGVGAVMALGLAAAAAPAVRAMRLPVAEELRAP
jgi:ABC-type lipoprotein release transport system permease subunit